MTQAKFQVGQKVIVKFTGLCKGVECIITNIIPSLSFNGYFVYVSDVNNIEYEIFEGDIVSIVNLDKEEEPIQEPVKAEEVKEPIQEPVKAEEVKESYQFTITQKDGTITANQTFDSLEEGKKFFDNWRYNNFACFAPLDEEITKQAGWLAWLSCGVSAKLVKV